MWTIHGIVVQTGRGNHIIELWYNITLVSVDFIAIFYQLKMTRVVLRQTCFGSRNRVQISYTVCAEFVILAGWWLSSIFYRLLCLQLELGDTAKKSSQYFTVFWHIFNINLDIYVFIVKWFKGYLFNQTPSLPSRISINQSINRKS